MSTQKEKKKYKNKLQKSPFDKSLRALPKYFMVKFILNKFNNFMKYSQGHIN